MIEKTKKTLIKNETEINSLGDIIRKARLRKGLTKKALAKELEITTNIYRKYETEKFEHSVLLALRIAEILGFSWEDIANAGIQQFDYKDYHVHLLGANFQIISDEGELIGALPSTYYKLL